MAELTEDMTDDERREIEDTNAAFREVLASASGRRVLYWVLGQSMIADNAFCGDNNSTNFSLGRQYVGKELIKKFDEIDPRNYPRLMLAVADDEAMKRAALELAAKTKDKDDDDAA